MKTLFAAVLFCSLSLGAFAQQATAAKTNASSSKIMTTYRCPVCGYTNIKTGECPKDKTALVKVGDYYCPECYMTSAKAEKCPMCGVDMKKMQPQPPSGTNMK
jgi:rubrerythrin